MQLPYAVIAVSVLSAVYPQVSRSASHDPERYAALVSGGLRILLALLLPAAVLLAVCRHGFTRRAGRGLRRLVRGGCLLLGAHLGRRCPGVLAGTAALAVRLLSPVGAMVAVALLVRGLVEGERTGGAVSAAGTVLVVALASGTTHLLLLRWCAPTVVAEVTGRVRRTRHRS